MPPPSFPQALKYAFQTHDRLCLVMEYANGGEVCPQPPACPSGCLLPGSGGQRETYWSVIFLLSLPPPEAGGETGSETLSGSSKFTRLVSWWAGYRLRPRGLWGGGRRRRKDVLKGCRERACGSGSPILYFQQGLLPEERRRHSPCPPVTHSSSLTPLSPPGVTRWLHSPCGLVSQLVSTCSRVVLFCLVAVAPSFACPLLRPPPQLSTWRLLSRLPSIPCPFSFCRSCEFLVLTVPRTALPVPHVVLTAPRSSWGRCHHVTGLGAILPSSGPGVSPLLPPSAGSCSSTCRGSVSSQRSGPAFMARRSSQPWSTCTRGTWCTVTSR